MEEIRAGADGGGSTAADAIERLLNAQISLRNNRRLQAAMRLVSATGQLARRLRALSHPALSIVDEIRYLPVSRNGSVLLFQLINVHYEQASTVLTSNKGGSRSGARSSATTSWRLR